MRFSFSKKERCCRVLFDQCQIICANSGTFEAALAALKMGFKVTRSGWNRKGMYLEVQRPDEHSKMTLPYIYIKTTDDQFVPWLASQTDLLAEDWIVLEANE